ncbi:MAG: N-acetyltransferase [Acidobacteriota bacterium]|nr:N-acetyltransferase [Acidobacteriota bacterium]
MAKVMSDDNPFFRHAEMQLFVARRGPSDVGRIAAILDRAHNEFHGESVAFFGFFESIDDPEVAGRLFDAAALWGRERKLEVLRGPANPSLNDEAGLLVDGFGSPPVFMMTYNPPSYVALLEDAGFRKAKDLLAYWFEIGPEPQARLDRLADRVRRNEPDVVVRKVSKRTLRADLPKIRDIYNSAWEKNWGFVPMTPDEMDFMAGRLKPLLDEDFVFLAERRRDDGSPEPIAFQLAMPDYNPAIAATKGRLLPFGWLKFLIARRRVDTLRVVTLGIKREYRLRGINAVMFATSLRSALGRGFTGVEVSWLLEENEMVIRTVKLWGGRLYKTYRIYEREIGGDSPGS